MKNSEKKKIIQNWCKIQGDIKLLDKHNKEDIQNLFLNYPSKLYKFRECNNKNFNTLKKRRIWLSRPVDWPDNNDTKFLFDLKSDLKNLYKVTNGVMYDISKYLLEKAIKNNKIDQNECCKYYLYNSFTPMERDICHKINNSLYNFLNFNETIRNSYGFYCMSERCDNDNQWIIYSKDCTGFCIEYDFFQKDINVIGNIVPIIYGKRKKESFINLYLNAKKPNNEELNKILFNKMVSILTKKKEFVNEEEWRYIGLNIDKSCEIEFDYVSAIYLGDKISEYNEKRLIKIAKQLDVKIYKRKYNNLLNKYYFDELNIMNK